jgi:hypothetical protein
MNVGVTVLAGVSFGVVIVNLITPIRALGGTP